MHHTAVGVMIHKTDNVNCMRKFLSFTSNPKVIILIFSIFWILSVVYMRFCENIRLVDSHGHLYGKYPTLGWNFLAKENTHMHIILLDFIILAFISNKLIKSVIWTDVLFMSQKAIIQIIGLLFGKVPAWTNQRIIGLYMTLGILVIFSIVYSKDFIKLALILWDKLKKHCVWLKTFGI